MSDNKAARFVIDAEPVAGTPLILIHWWRYERDSLGTRFTLIDLKRITRLVAGAEIRTRFRYREIEMCCR